MANNIHKSISKGNSSGVAARLLPALVLPVIKCDLNSLCVCLRRHPGESAQARINSRPVAHDKNRTLPGGPNLTLYPLKGRVEETHGVMEGKGEIKGEYYAHEEKVYQSSLKPGGGSSGVELFTVLQGCYFAQHVHICLDVMKSHMPLIPQFIA